MMQKFWWKIMQNNKYVIFDLDDTLVSEIDFLKSAYYYIAAQLGKDNLYEQMLEKYFAREDVFQFVEYEYGVLKSDLLHYYRTHEPNITLKNGAEELLSFLKDKNYKLGLITDGRSVSQRNKLKALGIENYFDKIIISEEFGSEKPDENNYKVFVEDSHTYFYIGDNFTKDFIAPNRLGWTTIALLDDGQNIHKQELVSDEYSAKFCVTSLLDIKDIIETI